MMGVGVVGCRIYGAVCDATCAIAALEMVWVERNGLILRMPGTNFEKLPRGGLQNDVWCQSLKGHHPYANKTTPSEKIPCLIPQ